MTEVPRMRTAPEAIAELRKIDPNTALTLRALRRMMNTGEIPVVNVNSKRLLNLDTLFDYLSKPVAEPQTSSSDYGKIRRIG